MQIISSHTVTGQKLVTKLQNMATCEKRCQQQGGFSCRPI